ncbi:hypothetical protein SASPL_101745 [Salvia splendens]|uniref:Sm domain-containing protein n=1 Tax=Salvia splendens TaxID=180675 RepID=A0A8X9ADK3_SALSN|nr:hypothetical protein SASPL_101745 [Salvia splendens]
MLVLSAFHEIAVTSRANNILLGTTGVFQLFISLPAMTFLFSIFFTVETISIITNDGRNIVGILKGFDQATNIILDESHERVYSTKVSSLTSIECLNKSETRSSGLLIYRKACNNYIFRGDNFMISLIFCI